MNRLASRAGGRLAGAQSGCGHLTQAVKAASKTKRTYLSAQYTRLRGRRGAAIATVAVAHSMLVAVFHILDRLVPYQDLGDDWFIRRHSPERHVRKLVNQQITRRS